MFDPIRWFDDCEQALADADYLATRLARMAGAEPSDLPALRMRIAALRAEFERARLELGAPKPVQLIHPDWLSSSGSPWCAPSAGRGEDQDRVKSGK